MPSLHAIAFPFLLIAFTLMTIISRIFGTPLFFNDESNAGVTFFMLFLVILICVIWYFYRANRKMYQESWIIAFVRSTLMLSINMTLFVALMVGLTLLTVFNLQG